MINVKPKVLKIGDTCWLRPATATAYHKEMPDPSQPLLVAGKRPKLLIVRRADGFEFPITRVHIYAYDPGILGPQREKAEHDLELEQDFADRHRDAQRLNEMNSRESEGE